MDERVLEEENSFSMKKNRRTFFVVRISYNEKLSRLKNN
jgi:hypothetical protein